MGGGIPFLSGLGALAGTMLLVRLVAWCLERRHQRREWKVELEREIRAWQRMRERG